MCKVKHLIHNRKASKDLRNSDIARSMTMYLQEKVSDDSVQTYFSGGAGVPLDKIGAFLDALGLKVVDDCEVTIQKDELTALKLFASKGIGGIAGENE